MANFNQTLYNTFLGRGIHVHTFPRRDINIYHIIILYPLIYKGEDDLSYWTCVQSQLLYVAIKICSNQILKNMIKLLKHRAFKLNLIVTKHLKIEKFKIIQMKWSHFSPSGEKRRNLKNTLFSLETNKPISRKRF